ncbi:ethanolamine phosphate phosphodiesterase [Marchantia polymorpha subsp. ruderalis]|uniref:Calcineurin-like phosphoesterase domain-containing protein n=2 Tax=Marchantia polymorpha TaxID=3197 RepID=A0AAF6BGN1_MARPO|nr:hypothetical protein MARPO_0048s0109 [Marchantia polymorpha]BBN11165.1 hypothetical protein Mp_5g09610 [Marchantia polymorpha subsp. ruderalis]|eukprot:PTQ39007.1 hypothetical protein MARPO_0048s0109 [Marchantia polymorpha]
MAIRGQWSVTLVIAGLWAISLLYGEMFAYWFPIFSCSWPVIELNGTNAEDFNVKPIKIALIADPQITHQAGDRSPVPTTLKFSEFYSDIYMRRAFRSSVLAMEPDRIIILGDLIEGGYRLSDEEWNVIEKRFEHAFDQAERGSKKGSGRLPVYYLPGMQDLGSAEIQAKRPEILNRNFAAFGPSEYIVPIGGVEFIFTNAKAYDGIESSIQANARWGLSDRISSDGTHIPRVLLTATPLYKSNDVACKRQHVSETADEFVTGLPEMLHVDKPEDYLTLETTTKLLNLTKPMIVFSAHGYQGCSLTHAMYGSVTEHTVGTFNWQQENLHPSFMMISVAPESVSGSLDLVSVSQCFLPVQTWIYTWYLFAFLTGLVSIFTWPSQGVDVSGFFFKVMKYCKEIFRPDGGVKAKDEDADNGDWEMMWDAEGGMHLVKAHRTVIATKNTTQGVDRRGTALVRPAAKREPGSEVETIVRMDPSHSVHRTTRTRNRILYNWLRFALGPLAVLISLNFSLYVMLLMKDWT